ncbi:MAG: serine/threonine protein phosphatase [Clostridia bacterium]|nr:serine/threonine protein phosphatase [Clostridia bacterium]
MIYVLSDIHGNKQAFDSVMKQIDLQPGDHLYVIGDVIDRGEHGIELLKQLLSMENATVLLGNHELMMLNTFSGEYDLHDPFFPIFANRSAWKDWRHNGGWVTVNGLQGMSQSEIESLMAKVNALPLSVQIVVNETPYELVHGIPPDFYDEAWKWKTSKREFCTWERIEPETPLFADRTVIFGHTPTCFYQSNEDLSIWYGDNRIGIDCGSGLGQVHYHGTLLHGRLACLRLDDGKEFYSETE